MFPIQIREDLEMRLPQVSDAEELFAAVDRNRAYLREWLPWVDGTKRVEDSRDFIRAMAAEYTAGSSIATLLWWRGSIAGTCGAHHIDGVNRGAEIGYWVVSELQGQGIVTLSVDAMTRHLIQDRGMHRVAIRCAVGNARSCAVAERLGFDFEGTQRGAQLLNGQFVDLRVYSKLA